MELLRLPSYFSFKVVSHQQCAGAGAGVCASVWLPGFASVRACMCPCACVDLHWRGIRRGTVGSLSSSQGSESLLCWIGQSDCVLRHLRGGIAAVLCCPWRDKAGHGGALAAAFLEYLQSGCEPCACICCIFSWGLCMSSVLCWQQSRRAHNCVNCLASLASGELKLCFLVSCFRSWCEPARYCILARERYGSKLACTQPLHAALWVATSLAGTRSAVSCALPALSSALPLVVMAGPVRLGHGEA
jgi:hypothetical protein